MPAKVMVSRTDHTPKELRELASKHKFRDCRHRLRAIALVIERELSRAGIAGDAGVDVQTLCDWVKRYNGGGIDGLRDAARRGRDGRRCWTGRGPRRSRRGWRPGPIPMRASLRAGRLSTHERAQDGKIFWAHDVFRNLHEAKRSFFAGKLNSILKGNCSGHN